MMRKTVMKCHIVINGVGEGEALVTDKPLSLWGGLDPKSGEIIDRRNALSGKNVSGKVLVYPYGVGSCSSSAALLEASRLDKAPCAIVNLETEPIVAVGAILAKKLYGKIIPIVDKPDINPIDVIRTGDRVTVDANKGIIEATVR